MITAETRVTLSVSEANRLHRYCQAEAGMAACAGRNAVMAGLKLGKLLTDLKAATDHGVWGQLFKKESNTKLSSCAQFEIQTNVAHELHLNFNQQTANRYMRCYKAAKARLSATESAQLDATLNDRTAPSTPPELVAKATDGAETPRQMMLNLGVIATRKRTTHDRVKPLGFTGSGNPDGAQALTPLVRLAMTWPPSTSPRKNWSAAGTRPSRTLPASSNSWEPLSTRATSTCCASRSVSSLPRPWPPTPARYPMPTSSTSRL